MPSSVDWPGAVAVVERALGQRLVDGEHGARSRPSSCERAQPDEPGRRLLGAADERRRATPRRRRAGRTEQVGAVVERDLRRPRRGGDDVRAVGVAALAADARARRRRGRPSAAATSSCVVSGLEAQSSTCAPPAMSVRTRFAVSDVTCRHAATRSPSSGRSRARTARAPSAARASARPPTRCGPARPRPATGPRRHGRPQSPRNPLRGRAQLV